MIKDAQRVAAKAAQLLSGILARCTPLPGGDLSAVVRIALSDGREAVAKTSRNGIEAEMLRTMDRAGVSVPEVLASDSDIIVMSNADDSGSLAWSDLGEQVRRLHAVSGPACGWPVDYVFGKVPILNGWSTSWPDFWASKRLLPFIPHVPPEIARRLEALAADLTGRLPEAPRSLLHGDLWTGNVLAGRHGVTLIDPACYYGDGAVDVAMLTLFSKPSEDFHAAYGLRPDVERLAIYNLWPALVHYRLFGNAYLGMVDRFLRASGA